jgi:hypothetical protein
VVENIELMEKLNRELKELVDKNMKSIDKENSKLK